MSKVFSIEVTHNLGRPNTYDISKDVVQAKGLIDSMLNDGFKNHCAVLLGKGEGVSSIPTIDPSDRLEELRIRYESDTATDVNFKDTCEMAFLMNLSNKTRYALLDGQRRFWAYIFYIGVLTARKLDKVRDGKIAELELSLHKEELSQIEYDQAIAELNSSWFDSYAGGNYGKINGTEQSEFQTEFKRQASANPIVTIVQEFNTYKDALIASSSANQPDELAVRMVPSDKLSIGLELFRNDATRQEVKTAIGQREGDVVYWLKEWSDRCESDGTPVDIESVIMTDKEHENTVDQVRWLDVMAKLPEFTMLVLISNRELYKREIAAWNRNSVHKRKKQLIDVSGTAISIKPSEVISEFYEVLNPEIEQTDDSDDSDEKPSTFKLTESEQTDFLTKVRAMKCDPLTIALQSLFDGDQKECLDTLKVIAYAVKAGLPVLENDALREQRKQELLAPEPEHIPAEETEEITEQA